MPGRLAVPVSLFDVVVHRNGQAFAAFGAAALEYITTTSGFHTVAEPVYTDTAAFFRLVCSFDHFFLYKY